MRHAKTRCCCNRPPLKPWKATDHIGPRRIQLRHEAMYTRPPATRFSPAHAASMLHGSGGNRGSGSGRRPARSLERLWAQAPQRRHDWSHWTGIDESIAPQTTASWSSNQSSAGGGSIKQLAEPTSLELHSDASDVMSMSFCQSS